MYVACTRAREDLELFVPPRSTAARTAAMSRDAEPLRARTAVQRLEEWQEGYTGRISKRSTSFAGDPAFSRPSLDIPRELATPRRARQRRVPAPGHPRGERR